MSQVQPSLNYKYKESKQAMSTINDRS